METHWTIESCEGGCTTSCPHFQGAITMETQTRTTPPDRPFDNMATLTENTGAGNEGEFPCGCRIAMRRNVYANKERKLSATRYLCPLHGAAERMLGLLENLVDGYQPMYNGRPSCPVCGGFIDYESTHEDNCGLIAAIKEARGE